MALVSPGVQVSIIDESNYLPAPVNSVPFILLATAQNKVSGSGVGVAAGTTAANANKVYLISSQRDLAATYGNPFFYKTAGGQPINGYELNEYGLLAAYSVLGISNRAYIQRVDIDLAELVGSLTRPTGEPNNGTYWLDTTNTEWGIFEWNYTTNAFTHKTPVVITSNDEIDGDGIPLASIGNIGDYAVVTVGTTTDSVSSNPVYFKTPGLTVPTTTDPLEVVPANTWVLVGSDDWKLSWPAVTGSATNPTFTTGNNFYINKVLITVPVDTSVTDLAIEINDGLHADLPGVYANVVSGKLNFYANSLASNDGSTADGNGIIDLEVGDTGTPLTTAGITPRIYYAPVVQQTPNYQVPQWRSTSDQPHPTGSVWNKTNNVNNGANLVVSKYNATLGSWITQSCPIYSSDAAANAGLDPAGGGRNITAGATYAESNVNQDGTFTLQLFERVSSGATIVTGDNTSPTFTDGDQFTISASVKNSSTMSTPVTATLGGTTAADFAAAWSAANVANTTCAVTSSGAIQIQHTQGGVIYLEDVGSDTAVQDAGINTTVTGVRAGIGDQLILSNWVLFTYTPFASAPDQDPPDGRNWYYSAVDQVDIMINATVGGTQGWYGYKMVSSDVRGFNLANTNPTGPIISTTAPSTQTDGTDLVYGDLWVDTSDLELYPVIRRWENIDGSAQWVLINNADRTTESGILFADARWATNDTTDPIMDPIPTIVSLLSSDYLDPDAPDYALYPEGTLLFNTRRSGYNVKQFKVDYFSASDFDPSPTPVLNAWVSVSGFNTDGVPYMGRRAVRSMVVAAMKAGIDTQQELREEQRQFNLIACPNYPELMPNMVALNNERNETAFVVGDTPMRLPDNDADIVAWATNVSGQGTTNEDGLVTHDAYCGVFYPSCQTNDLGGSTVVQPPSHMMLRTIIRNDEVAFPWLAPAGTRRGIVDNAFQLGYVNGQTGAFVTTAVRQGLRDTLYQNEINPITYLPGSGIVNYGNKTTSASTTALDRINVARLVAYLRAQLQRIGANYVFEPNDQITRNQITNAVSGLMNDLIAKRGIYDYLVVCDLSNNTPARIDANELWVDIAIEPVKAVEFIYIPVRIQNTGTIAASTAATVATNA